MGFWRSLASSGMFHWPLCVTPSTIDKAISASNATNRILRSFNFCRASMHFVRSLPAVFNCRVAGYYERRISQTNSALKNRIAAATTQAMTVVAREFTSSPILLTVAGELNQRNHREGQLKAQHHLAEDQAAR